MKVLYIHQYFGTPNEPGGTRSYWISKELVKRGHKVTVVTSSVKDKSKKGRINVDGIDVVYLENDYDTNMSPLRKVWSFVSFIKKAVDAGAQEKDVDIVYATSTPLTVGVIAMMLKWRKKWRYVFEVRDLWPEFPIQIGAIRNKILISFLRWLERKIYKNSEFVVALSPGMQEGVVAAGMPIEKTAMIPNMSKPDKFFPHEPNLEVANKFGIDLNKFNVIHFGSMNPANGLDYIVEAAKLVQEKGDSEISFIFLGDGAVRPKMEGLVHQYGLKNVSFLGKHNMSVVTEVVNCCDVTVTTFLNLPILQTNSPNKLFDSLSAGKPIIVNSAGWTKDMAEREKCGFFVDPEDPADFANKILYYKDKKEELRLMGENSRRLSIEVYDKNILSAQVADVLEKCAKA